MKSNTLEQATIVGIRVLGNAFLGRTHIWILSLKENLGLMSASQPYLHNEHDLVTRNTTKDVIHTIQ